MPWHFSTFRVGMYIAMCVLILYMWRSQEVGNLEAWSSWVSEGSKYVCVSIFDILKKNSFFPKWSRKTWAKSLVFSLHSVIYFKFYMLKFCLLICLVFLLVFLLCKKWSQINLPRQKARIENGYFLHLNFKR